MYNLKVIAKIKNVYFKMNSTLSVEKSYIISS